MWSRTDLKSNLRTCHFQGGGQLLHIYAYTLMHADIIFGPWNLLFKILMINPAKRVVLCKLRFDVSLVPSPSPTPFLITTWSVTAWSRERTGNYCSTGSSSYCCIAVTTGCWTMSSMKRIYKHTSIIVYLQSSLWTKQVTQTLVC